MSKKKKKKKISFPKRILTGIQSSGRPHLGNILGAMIPAIEQESSGEPRFFFIADFHSLTSLRDADARRQNTLNVAAAWIAFMGEESNDILYRQSKIPEVCELMWYFSCFTSFGLLRRAHSFKDKADNLGDVNAGLFTYPVLMAADILLYNATDVPVGKDQKQHLEMTRDIVKSLNFEYGEILPVPNTVVNEEVMIIPGVDGRKMSKSYNNYIDIFETDKRLRKRVMQIKTDSLSVEDPKNPDDCNVFTCYKAVASAEAIEEMRKRYLEGGYGYGEAKQALFEAIVTRFADERARFNELMANPEQIEARLEKGEALAREIAHENLNRLRPILGF
jgi:tryptophanyl-tRNA synthetase